MKLRERFILDAGSQSISKEQLFQVLLNKNCDLKFMSNYLKKIISKFFFSKLFQIHPFTGWIINYIIDIPKIKSFKVLNKYRIKINIPSSEAFGRFKKCIEDKKGSTFHQIFEKSKI